MVALTTVLVLLAAAPPFPQSLSRPLLAKVEPFQWPSPKRFDAAWTMTAQDTRAHPLLFLDAGGGHGHWYVQTPIENGGVRLDCIVGERDSLTAATALGDSFEAKRWDKPVQVKVLERLEGEVSTDALVAWTYASTLLESNGPLYEEAKSSDPTLRDLVRELTKDRATVEPWAKKMKGDEPLFESFRHYRPRGTCSMDTTPQETARVFAELAFARGDLGRFLQLQVRIMGDQFERNAWSSYGEAAHDTESERLLRTGIDLDQFLIGLGVARPGRAEGLGAWRLARAINEAGRSEALLAKFEALATDPKLDAYNRLRATQTWFFIQVREGRGKEARQRAREEVTARAMKLELHPIAVAWLTE